MFTEAKPWRTSLSSVTNPDVNLRKNTPIVLLYDTVSLLLV